MNKLYKAIWLVMLLPIFICCNDADDVETIFTGKTWKLTLIAHDGESKMANFWGTDSERMNESLRLLGERNTFTIRFEGVAEGDNIQGQISGITITSAFSGGWNANGKNNNFHATITTGNSDGDTLADKFLTGLENATSYDGDSRNLYIIYKEGNATYRMFFHVSSN